MISRIFRRHGRKIGPQSKPRVPDGQRVYAIGDIHGRLDLLEALHAKIAHDLETAPIEDVTTIYIGDYIDRGPNSFGVIERLFQLRSCPGSCLFLKGNHEAMLLNFLNEPQSGTRWRRYGGTETLLSYRVDIGAAIAQDGMTTVAAEFRKKVPAHHTEFFDNLSIAAEVGDYFFCHAGVRPGVELQHQREEDLLWIREEFLNSTDDFGKVIVHGHSPVQSGEITANRINIDTGAYATGRLTCVALEGDGVRFLTADTSAVGS